MCGQTPHFSEGRRRKLDVNYFTDIHQIRFIYNVVDLCRKDQFLVDVLCITYCIYKCCKHCAWSPCNAAKMADFSS